MKLKNKFSVLTLSVVFAIAVFLSGCGIYSFSGASISPDIKTISIESFYNDTGMGPPNLSQLFTEKIKDYYQQNTSLAIVKSDGDLHLEGSISRWDLSPMAPTSSGDPNIPDVAGLMRLTITVQAEYTNSQDDTFNFKKSFSFYDDFNPNTQTLSAIENQLIETIFDQIILDIFNSSVANW
jgi:hypothetical protein